MVFFIEQHVYKTATCELKYVTSATLKKLQSKVSTPKQRV